MYLGQTFPLLLLAFAFTLYAQHKVRSTYANYSQVQVRARMTGADVAMHIMRDAGAQCDIEAIPGQMTDHYDPRTRTLRLSQDVYYGRSIAALGIAAHEVGHAIQHARAYSPLMLRNVVYPVCSLGSTLAFPLFFLGLFAVPALINVAIILYTLAVFFTLLTLPVEFNASRRALASLERGGYLDTDELAGARQVLTAAAMTYVAAAAMAVLQLLRMIMFARGRD